MGEKKIRVQSLKSNALYLFCVKYDFSKPLIRGILRLGILLVLLLLLLLLLFLLVLSFVRRKNVVRLNIVNKETRLRYLGFAFGCATHRVGRFQVYGVLLKQKRQP